MAKRFTDTGKWKKEFIKGLPAKMKLLWFYILDDCDHAGIWEVDMEVASLRIGEPITYEEAFVALGEKISPIGKYKWFIEDFIFFQYGELRENNRMHQSVMAILKKYNIQLPKGYISPLQGAKDKDKDKDKVKDKVKEEGGVGETQHGPKPPEDDQFEPLTEKWFNYIFDELFVEQKAMAYRDHDMPSQVEKFKSKVRGSPEEYIYRDTAGIRAAFDYHLRNSKTDKHKQKNNIPRGTLEEFRNL